MMDDITYSFPSTVSGISFSFLSTEDVRRISVKQIVNPVLLDDLNRPTIGGLYDPALGPLEKQDICATCKLTYFTCPGHFGHIELPAPVFHPLFIPHMFNLLRGTCLFCHRFKMSRTVLCKYIAKFRLLEHGLLDAALGVDDLHLRVRQATGDENDSPEESAEAFQQRVDLFVRVHLARASSSKRDHYKDSLVYQARKSLITEFLKATIMRKCYNEGCNAHGYTFRREGYTKIIEYDLSRKQKIMHSAINLRRPDVLLQQRVDQSNKVKPEVSDDRSDSSEESSDSDGSGEPTFSDGESEEEHPSQANQVPRAANGREKASRGRNERVMAPEECRAHLRRLFWKEAYICSLLFGRHGPFATISPGGISIASADMFFLQVIPVTPTRFRPAATLGETVFEHPQNELLARIINTSYRLRDLNVDLRAASEKSEVFEEVNRKKVLGALLDCLVQLQIDVNSFMDSSKNPMPFRQGKLPPAGVKQGLEKKEGLFRKHMMGKRVNYAARSVISPDVLIEPNEIGVPPVFAKKLTFPEPVTPANFHELRQRVIAGPRDWPGASMVEYEDGRQLSLAKLSVEQRTAIANQLLTPQEGVRPGIGRRGLFTQTPSINKKVYRHLTDGDMLIVNRQPTLHKPSMMAHRARVLRGEKTIRMHYANCNSYNADFDGDEMNLHFPQNQIARAEAMFIANTEQQYLVPTSGKPLRGLIQDHIVAGVWMTCQDSFFTRDEYCQLLYGALRPEDDPYCTGLVTLPPSIWKPRSLWTGKQIISTVLRNLTPSNAEGLNLNAKARVPSYLWGHTDEDHVIFMDGEFLCGVLDKAAFGATNFGLVHAVYELYGADVAGKLLGTLSRLFTKFLQHRAFTCRMDDLALTPEGNANRTNLLEKGRNYGTEAAIENFPSLADTPKSEVQTALVDMLEDVLRDDKKMAGLDMTVKSRLAKLTKSMADACLPNGLVRKFPHNNMQTMTLSGAKGSAVNAQQISCALGQQELEGRRVPVMVSGKTLPSFRSFDTRAIAGGYVSSRFLTGIKPQEFYFHCMAGREGLIDTAVKTSRSGYLQRCLIKHLEGIRVHYDYTVRGSDSSVYQFHYGGDSLDVTKQTYLNQFDFFASNEVSLINLYQPRSVEGIVDVDEAMDYTKKVIKKSRERPDKYTYAKRDKYDPALSKYNPSRYLGSTSEKFAELLDQFIKSNPGQLLKSKDSEMEPNTRRKSLMSTKHFRLLLNLKYMRSLVEPGEAVGLLASQSVGEPSTQMTLNTFHFAGHGAANVTLGIPRLREIIMTASQKPKTPSMTMNVHAGVSRAKISNFCKRARRLTLSQVVDNVTVTERLILNGDSRRREYTVTITFFPRNEFESEYDVVAPEILATFSKAFPLILKKEITMEMKKFDADLKSQFTQVGKGKKSSDVAQIEDADDEDENAPTRKDKDNEDQSEIGDGDAEDEKRARQRREQVTYESDDEDIADDDEETQDVLEVTDIPSTPERIPQTNSNLLKEVEAVSKRFEKNLSQTTAFTFNDSACTFRLVFGDQMPKLLLVGIVEQTCRKTVIREIPGISECFPSDPVDNEQVKIITNGSNLGGLWSYLTRFSNVIKEDEINSNDIYSILKTYGVEMARATILREISDVFGAYKIDVNGRHLELIADYMTFDGGYRPFNRKGISANPSPLLKASYETTAAFLTDATLYGDFDDLTTPSSSIVLGRPNPTGTGVFDVVMPVG